MTPPLQLRTFLVAGTILLFFIAVTLTLHSSQPSATSTALQSQVKSIDDVLNKTLHILLPASESNVDLCKTLLTGAILDYPTPTLIAWNDTFDRDYLLGGGSHLAKIEKVLQYLETDNVFASDDLVLMMDAYDIWFQLRPEVLLRRYHVINAEANERLKARLGKAVKAEGLQQTIIFGAGKRCAPNQMHTIGCYPMPDSPLPDDLYGENTETVMGRNKYTSLKQRYLNSGYIIGPAADLRSLFKRAQEKMEAKQDQDAWDNGSHGSDFMYHGSDQSIFSIILGEQEYQREIMRRKHMTWNDRARGRSKLRPTRIEGTVIEDVLHPSFLHEPGVAKEGKPDEFGIGLDYFSQLGQQTINTDEDVHYLQYNESIEAQLEDRHGLFDCKSRVAGSVSRDIINSRGPLEALNSQGPDWTEMPLFTNVCLDQVPVMIHHNGDKGARAWQWPMTWMQSRARKLLRQARRLEERGGAFLTDGQYLPWDELCPAEYEWELFRDVEKTE